MSNVIVHKNYEMGKAPYKFIGVWSAPSLALQEANPSAYNIAMQSAPPCCKCCCDHCSTGIKNHYILSDANGDKFAVGSSCIDKLNNVLNLSKVQKAKRDHQAALRQARAEVKRLKREADRQAVLDVERAKNNGLTDYELEAQKLKQKNDSLKAIRKNKAAYFLDALAANGSDFCDSVSRSIIDYGSLPSGRGGSILLSICAKHYSGKTRGAAFDIEYDHAAENLDYLTETLAKGL